MTLRKVDFTFAAWGGVVQRLEHRRFTVAADSPSDYSPVGESTKRPSNPKWSVRISAILLTPNVSVS